MKSCDQRTLPNAWRIATATAKSCKRCLTTLSKPTTPLSPASNHGAHPKEQAMTDRTSAALGLLEGVQ